MITKKIQCTGCAACVAICPNSCIDMRIDDEGFHYPVIDSNKCVDCGLCNSVCPILRKNTYTACSVFDKPVAVGGFHKSKEILDNSSSGGFFSLIAEYIINRGGTVYGCTLDEKMRAKHIRVDNMKDLSKLRGSKYVQSDIKHVFLEILTDIGSGNEVLFTGTPCECASVRSFLDAKNVKNTDNLFLCDFICHGVPSPAVFHAYVQNIETKCNDKIAVFKFRNKDYGWNPTGLQLGTYVETKKSKKIRKYPAYKDYYMNGFLEDLFLRPSCYECKFKTIPKYYSEITFADFWGVNKLSDFCCNSKGTSLVLINNDKGQRLFNETKNDFTYEIFDYEKAIKSNKSLLESAHINNRRQRFFQDFISGVDFSVLEKKYMTTMHWAMHKIAGMVWITLRSIIKTFFSLILKCVGIEWSDKQWDSFFQFVKFCIVGMSNVMVSYFINICVLTIQRPFNINCDYIIANSTAFVLSVLWSFYWNSSYVFKEKEKPSNSKGKTLLKTYASYAFSGIILNNMLGTVWIKVFHFSKYLAPLLNLPFTVPCNFLLNKFWAFDEREL